MDHIVTTIIPIFSFVILGTIARSKGFLFPEFLELADRPGYYLAKPVVVSVTTLFSAFTFSFWLSLG